MWGSSVQVGQLQTSSGWDEATLRRDEKTEDTMIHNELEDVSCDDDIHCQGIKRTSMLHRFRSHTGEDIVLRSRFVLF